METEIRHNRPADPEVGIVDLSELPDVQADRCPHRLRPQRCSACLAEVYGDVAVPVARGPRVQRTDAAPTDKQRGYADALARKLGHEDAQAAAIAEFGGWCLETRADWSEAIGLLKGLVADRREAEEAAREGLEPGFHD